MARYTIPINSDKLRAEIYAKGYDLTSASIKIGMERNYFSGILKRGLVPPNTVYAVKGELGINPEKYVFPDLGTEKELNKPGGVQYILDSEIKKELCDVIYRAVKTAMVEALKGE